MIFMYETLENPCIARVRV